MYVVKASGKREEFNVEKIRKTCLRAGASKDLTERIVSEVKNRVYDGITTKEILDITLKLLKKEPGAAARYDLKRSIMSLGPAGFPFEKFMAEVLRNYGYKTNINEILKGKCVNHETDIVAEKDGKRYLVECKYHNALGIYTDLKVAMYTHARFLDLGKNFDQAWLACNTRCTMEARRYAQCVGLKITSWKYPKKESLEKMIENKRLYPVTILRSVKGFAKDRLFQARITLAKDLLDYSSEDLKRMTSLPRDTVNKILDEVRKVAPPADLD
jgi:hypothetical protein